MKPSSDSEQNLELRSSYSSSRRACAIPAALAMASMLALASQLALSEVIVVDVVAVAKGYRTSELTGRPVVNDKNERIGTIDDLVIGQDRVLFAILQIGGFLGIGSHLVAVPYKSLELSEDGRKIVLSGASRQELKKLPEFKYRA